MTSSADIVLSVKNLFKSYPNEKGKKEGGSFVLENVSFDLFGGEILGIIGRNGAGKSTLLKVISEISAPSSGSVEYSGTLASIMDIGSGFHPDLSGKENIYLSCSFLGNSRAKTDTLIHGILEFSGLRNYIHLPVKTYSNGMYLRLAFSVAFHANINILLLDEVLAVGDAEFNRRCYHKIKDLSAAGTSIVLVSHSLDSILEFCNRCLLLDQGHLITSGEPLQVVEHYMDLVHHLKNKQLGATPAGITSEPPLAVNYNFYPEAFSSQHLVLRSLNIHAAGKKESEQITMGDDIEIFLTCEKLQNQGSFEIIYYLENLNGLRVLTDSPALRPGYTAGNTPGGIYHVQCTLPKNLLNRGVYSLGIVVCINGERQAELNAVARFKVHALSNNEWDARISTVFRPHLNWKITKVSPHTAAD